MPRDTVFTLRKKHKHTEIQSSSYMIHSISSASTWIFMLSFWSLCSIAVALMIILDYVSIITCRVVVLASNKPLKPSRMKILQ